jgi:hypothetical protein
MDIDSSPYSPLSTDPLSPAPEGLDEGVLPTLTSTNIINTILNNPAFSQALETPSSDPLAMGDNPSSIRARANIQSQEQGRKRGPSSPI